MSSPPPDAAARTRPIERLPTRRDGGEAKEAMNCSNCRKRKIKCNRLRPTCEACRLFDVECIYDAVPRKRGPKTEGASSLLNRVRRMQKTIKLEDDRPNGVNGSEAYPAPTATVPGAPSDLSSATGRSNDTTFVPEQVKQSTAVVDEKPLVSPTLVHSRPVNDTPAYLVPDRPASQLQASRDDRYLHAYFEHFHGRPFFILDETATRHRWHNGQLSVRIMDGICAVSARSVQGPGQSNKAAKIAEEFWRRARAALDTDEPMVENLQICLLLASAALQAGKGPKCYMLLSNAISMALALNLHRELPSALKIPHTEREGRRRLFWTCFLMDRFTASGAIRPSLITDESITLRLPAPSGEIHQPGAYFSNGSSMHISASSAMGFSVSSTAAMLIDVVRILGTTNRYLAAGGIKSDSHFPWHQQSTLSKIRHELEVWCASNQDAFIADAALYTQVDGINTVLARLIYHLIYCLMYRPFLPIDLMELASSEQHQPWQLEATKTCFAHANAVANLVEAGRQQAVRDWPAFVAYCLCAAGTVHIHGAHYARNDGSFYSQSSEFLSREMSLLQEIRSRYAAVQHQTETLQAVYGCHTMLVESLSSNPLRFSPVFQMEDFFDRYPAHGIDGAFIAMRNIAVEQSHESLPAYEGMHLTQHPKRDISTTNDEPQAKKQRTTDVQPFNATPFDPPTSITPLAASPAFSFSQWFTPLAKDQGLQANPLLDSTFSLGLEEQQTPGGASAAGSVPEEKDPFLALLEQLAENETSDFDEFLRMQGGEP